MTELLPTLAAAHQVFGDGVPLDDPAEAFHEASRLYPRAAAPPPPGMLLLLAGDPVMHASVERASRRHPHRPSIELGRQELPAGTLADALTRRRSTLSGSDGSLGAPALASVLATAYGARTRDGVERRAVPSGGALYPLELYVLALDVAGVEPGVYHYEPYRHELELLREGRPAEPLAEALIDPSLVASVTAAIVVTGVFWRSRFKYGLRGYRFVLLEAGHVGQNVVLAAAALGLPALPLGGFYDRPVESLVGVDGLDEAVVYVVLLGG